ncbi:MAG: YjgP/YjgQ family permease [Armatimonadetes bacterium]|nr:MAG: YjgP/YjgQ family permease [Armatimonadota bacterium]MBL1151294.1 YjgP/YjgQ family permease [Armatimonadota bacterium]
MRDSELPGVHVLYDLWRALPSRLRPREVGEGGSGAAGDLGVAGSHVRGCGHPNRRSHASARRRRHHDRSAPRPCHLDLPERNEGASRPSLVKKLDRYVLRELLVPFLIGTVAVVLMFQANLLIFQFKNVSAAAFPLSATLKLVLLRTPQFLNLTLPVGISLAASLAISRLARDAEINAVRSAGTPILRLVLPVVAFGVLVAIGNFYLAERVMPTSEREARRLMVDMTLTGGVPEFKNNVLIRLRNYSASFGSVSRAGPGTIRLQDILLIERPRVDEVWLYTAESGEYTNGVWTMRKPYFRMIKGDLLVLARPVEDLVINERISLDEVFLEPITTEQTLEELRESIQQRKQAGWDTTTAEVALHTRYSVPASCVVFALAAPVFAIWLGRRGGFVGVLFSILLVFLYYNAFVISTEILGGKSSVLSPFWAAWLPNVLFLVFGLVGIRRLE